MEIPILKTIDVGGVPENTNDFLIGATAYIGEKNSEGADCFYFELATPKHLENMLKEKRIVNCRNTFIVNTLEIKEIENEINRILQDCIRPTWSEVAQAINKYLAWEYDDIQYTSEEEARELLNKIDNR